jgi:glyoxylase-like metal-dependent hydrolase (beta-lactamase superfamily II)
MRSAPPMPRTDRILPGVWRLRLPLPWPGVPHGNAFAVAAGEGIILFDTGIGGEGRMRELELALAQAGFAITDVRLVVCTHAHVDHCGLAAPITEAAGCELWIHPAWEHIRRLIDDPDAALDRRLEVARQSGVPGWALERYEADRRGSDTGIEGTLDPDRDLLPGVEVETDLGAWQVHETPGHAPSHVVLHQPERRLMISGDHLLGRVSLFYDYGHTPDPVGEFLASLDVVEGLDTGLCLAGHGRPFRDTGAKVTAYREMVTDQLERMRDSLASGPKTAFETVPDLVGRENLNAATATLGLQLSLAYLDHLALAGEAEPIEGSDPRRWRSEG